MKNKYMIVISFDAVSCEDLEVLRKLPNFSKIIKEGALIKNVDSIYPSLTYPAHATIVTGRYPKSLTTKLLPTVDLSVLRSTER